MLKGEIMKIRSKISLYNLLTVIFAILTVVSLGAYGSEISAFRVFVNTAMFSLLTYNCFMRENELREELKNRKRIARQHKDGLAVYKHPNKTTMPAA